MRSLQNASSFCCKTGWTNWGTSLAGRSKEGQIAESCIYVAGGCQGKQYRRLDIIYHLFSRHIDEAIPFFFQYKARAGIVLQLKMRKKAFIYLAGRKYCWPISYCLEEQLHFFDGTNYKMAYCKFLFSCFPIFTCMFFLLCNNLNRSQTGVKDKKKKERPRNRQGLSVWEWFIAQAGTMAWRDGS